MKTRMTKRSGETVFWCKNGQELKWGNIGSFYRTHVGLAMLDRLADLEDAIETIEAAIGNAGVALPHLAYADGLKYAYEILTDTDALHGAMNDEFDGFSPAVAEHFKREADISKPPPPEESDPCPHCKYDKVYSAACMHCQAHVGYQWFEPLEESE
jgi:hypothetical protein